MRAKFMCNSITDFGSYKEAKLSAIYGTEGENKDFTDATPAGDISIGIESSAPASKYLEVGKAYYIDFTEAE